MVTQRILYTILFSVVGLYCLAQVEVRDMLKKRMVDKNIPGLAYLIAKDGQILSEGYLGQADVELGIAVSDSSVFAIASMSKTFTACAILMLQEEGKLKLEDPVKSYIPEAPESWNTITLGHLLTHSSGIVDDWDLFTWQKSNEHFIQSQTDSAFLQVLFEQDLLFEPGTETHYACGPFVLGVVIERITQAYYGNYIQSKILKPLNLKHTYIDHPYQIIPNRVSGYFPYDKIQLHTDISQVGNGLLISPLAYGRADIGIRTTAHDLMRFYDALLGDQLINEESRRIMFGPSNLNNGDLTSYGAGWMNWPLSGRFISEHGGIFRTGFHSQGFMIPEERFIIVILTNMYDVLNFPLVQKIASIYYPEFKPLSLRKVESDQKPQLTKLHFTLLQAFDEQSSNQNICNPNFPRSYLNSDLKQAMSEIESLEYIGAENIYGKEIFHFNTRIHQLRFYRLVRDKSLYTTFYLDEEEKVVFIDYPESE